ncbi:hypothetical protein ACXWOP_09945, partial [Streptococcus pyogenes]
VMVRVSVCLIHSYKCLTESLVSEFDSIISYQSLYHLFLADSLVSVFKWFTGVSVWLIHSFQRLADSLV